MNLKLSSRSAGAGAALLCAIPQLALAGQFENRWVEDFQLQRQKENLQYWNSVATPSEEQYQRFVRARIRNLSNAIAERETSSRASAIPGDERAALELELERARSIEPALAQSLQKGSASLLQMRNSEGIWSGSVYMSSILTSEYVLMLSYLNKLDDRTATKAASYLKATQNVDGSFGMWDGGPGDPAVTKMGSMALDQISLQISDTSALQASKRASAWLRKNPGTAQAMSYVSLFAGLFGYEKLPDSPNALYATWLLKRPPMLGSNKLAVWARALINSYAIIIGLKSSKAEADQLNRLQRAALKRLVDDLHDFTDQEGQIFFYSTTTVLGVIAYHELSKLDPSASANVEKGLGFLKTLVEEDSSQLKVKFAPSTNWDTPNSLLALYSGETRASSAIAPDLYSWVTNFIYKTQSPSGAWSNQAENTKFPDSEGAAQMLNALRAYGRKDASSTARHIDGLKWLLSIQTRQGGWATFEKNVPKKAPGPMSFELSAEEQARISEMMGQGSPQARGGGRLSSFVKVLSVLRNLKKDAIAFYDYPAADLTGHVVETLGNFGFNTEDQPIRKAHEFLRADLGSYPVWWSRYGVDFLWGTQAAITGLSLSGAPMNQPFIGKAVDFAISKQNADGGWGQSMESARDFSKAGSSRTSNVIQTAQGLMTLVSSGRALSESARKAALYLIKAQGADGRWEDQEPHCLGGGFLLSYTYVPQYMTMIALKRYFEAIKSSEALLSGSHRKPASEDRVAKDAAAKSELLNLHFFAEGGGMHLSPDLIKLYDVGGGITSSVRRRAFQKRWGLNLDSKGDAIGLFSVDYKKMEIGVLGCVACHSGKAAGQLIIGLGNKNIDVGRIGEDALFIEKSWGRIPRRKNEDYKAVEKSALSFARLLSDDRINNLTQGMVPTSMIREWFYRMAGEPYPTDMHRAAVKVPSFWGYGLKRQVGQFCDGAGDGTMPGWGAAVELAGGQTPEVVRSYVEKLEHAESILGDLLPPKYPFAIKQEFAERGKQLFERSCAKCHGKYEYDSQGLPVWDFPKFIPWERVKTDRNRLDANTPEWYALVAKNPLVDIMNVTDKRDGYFAPRLHAIWSRFPYLHNGSVPTLSALLSPPLERPSVFSLEESGEEHRFDQEKVGLKLPAPGSKEDKELKRRARAKDRDVYYTERVGHGNEGHDFYTDLTDSEKQDLLEYLKTL